MIAGGFGILHRESYGTNGGFRSWAGKCLTGVNDGDVRPGGSEIALRRLFEGGPLFRTVPVDHKGTSIGGQ